MDEVADYTNLVVSYCGNSIFAGWRLSDPEEMTSRTICLCNQTSLKSLQKELTSSMLTLLLDLIISVLLFRKRTPAIVVVAITAVVIIIAVVAVASQAKVEE